jgi:hypothetical protein
MKFVEFEAFGPNGQFAKVLVNPDQVCMIAPVVIPGEIKGANGEAIGKVVSALDFGVKAIPINCTVAGARIKLEEVK